jgi:hypothetical protein
MLVSACAYLQHPKFGALPQGERLASTRASSNFEGDGFRNPEPTPMFAEGTTFLSVLVGPILACNVLTYRRRRRADPPPKTNRQNGPRNPSGSSRQ